MTKEKFDEFKLKTLKYVTDHWKDNKSFPPHLFFINNNDARKLLPLPLHLFDDQSGKENLCNIIVEMLSTVKAKASCITTEGWMVATKEENEIKDEEGNFIRPSQHPNKQEVLTFMFEALDNDDDMMTLLNTDGNLTPHSVGKDINGNESGDVKMQGLFQGLLKKSKELWSN